MISSFSPPFRIRFFILNILIKLSIFIYPAVENKSEPPYQQNMGGVKRFLKISCFKRKKQATPCVSPIFSISGFSPLYFNGSAILQQTKKGR